MIAPDRKQRRSAGPAFSKKWKVRGLEDLEELYVYVYVYVQYIIKNGANWQGPEIEYHKSLHVLGC